MDEIAKFTVADNPVIFTGEVGSNEESLAKTARLFYAGTHKGRKYSKDDLKKIVDNFNGEERIPIQLDHSTSAKDTVGITKRVWLSDDGTEIHGELEFLGKENVDRVRLGLWKQVSVGLSIKQPEMKLLEVSITPFPALEEAQVFSKDNGGDEMNGKMTEPENKTEMTEIEEIRTKFAKIKAEKEKLEEKIRFMESQETIEQFVLDGKTTPAMKETELKLFHSMSEEQQKEFIEYAGSIIDGSLADRYPIPLYPTPAIIKEITADLAASECLSQITGNRGENDEPTQAQDLRRKAIEILDRIASGKINLQIESTPVRQNVMIQSTTYNDRRKFDDWNPSDPSTMV